MLYYIVVVSGAFRIAYRMTQLLVYLDSGEVW